MNKLRPLLLYGTLVASIVLLAYTVLRTPCSSVIEYDIGVFDERYNISRESFLSVIQEAEIPWEEAADKPLFVYSPGADFKINLLWSENQERVIQGKDLEQNLDVKQQSLNSVQREYELLSRRYEAAEERFNRNESVFQRELDAWNRNPGTQSEHQDLKRQESSLRSDVQELNMMGAELNKLAQLSNQQVNQYNEGVNEYNNLFDGREFHAGDTDGTEINVHSFDGREELHTLIVHEFGHVLGIDHLDDPGSVMYYLLNDENDGGNLSDMDRQALFESCRL